MQYLDYHHFPSESQLGIARVFYNGTTWAFKVLRTEAGGFYIKPPAVKIGEKEYINAHQIDSMIEYKKLEQFVHAETSNKLKELGIHPDQIFANSV